MDFFTESYFASVMSVNENHLNILLLKDRKHVKLKKKYLNICYLQEICLNQTNTESYKHLRDGKDLTGKQSKIVLVISEQL